MIPETFVSAIGRFFRKKEMQQYEKDKAVFQAFSEVCAKKDRRRFKQTVQFLGNHRAWHRGPPVTQKTISLHHSVSAESKIYEAHNFKWGWLASHLAGTFFKHMSHNKRYYRLLNNLAFYKKENDTWVPCQTQDRHRNDLVMIEHNNFLHWNTEYKANHNQPPTLGALLKTLPSATDFSHTENNNAPCDLDQWAAFCQQHNIPPIAITTTPRADLSTPKKNKYEKIIHHFPKKITSMLPKNTPSSHRPKNN